MAFEDNGLCAGVGVPQPRRVVLTRGHDALAIGAEGRGMAFEDGGLCAGDGVPQPRGVVGRRGHDALAIGAEGHAPHKTGMAFEDGGLCAGDGVPQPRGIVVRRGHDALCRQERCWGRAIERRYSSHFSKRMVCERAAWAVQKSRIQKIFHLRLKPLESPMISKLKR
jgi:hypothetical protein